MSAVIAIVGRPNVGKSTIFNRLLGKRQAIESNIPGTTRDRLYGKFDVNGIKVILVDTGGLETKTGNDIETNVQEQSKIAIDGADVIVLVVDVRSDLTSDDFYAAELLRKSKKPVILVANKCDNAVYEEQRYNLFELGFGEPLALSALHAVGLDDLEDEMEIELKALHFEPEDLQVEKEGIRIAFLGRPNVGKSTMINGILGKNEVVTSEVPGTTRDATEIPFEYKGNKFVLIDTAGLRRRGDIEKGLEKYSALRALQALELADICVLLINFEEGVTNQDCHISEFILEQNKGMILALNKIDIVKGEELDEMENRSIYQLKKDMPYLPWVSLVFTSGLQKKNLGKILDLALQIEAERNKILPQQDLDVWLDSALRKHPSNASRGKRKFEIVNVEQIDTNPPVFLFTCKWPEIMHFSYYRYLENSIRDAFGFGGTGMKLIFKKDGDPMSRRFKKSSLKRPPSEL